MNVYSYKSYRPVISNYLNYIRKKDPSWTSRRLADHAKIQKSYFTNVMKGRADFSLDQIYQIGRALRLAEQEIDYLELLLQIERTQNPARKKFLIKKRDAILADTSRQGSTLKSTPVQSSRSISAEYYINQNCSLVHAFLSIEKYRRKPKLLLDKLGISHDQLSEILVVLEKAAIISIKGNEIVFHEGSIYLSSDRSLSTIHGAHMRLLGVDRHRRQTGPNDEFLTLSFSADQTAYQRIRSIWIETLAKINEIIAESPAKNVYHINLDMFEV